MWLAAVIILSILAIITGASYTVAACPVDECPREGSGSEPRPKDLRLQFFETQEQCRSLKQEITSSIRYCA